MYNSMVNVYIACIVDVVLWEYIGSTWKKQMRSIYLLRSMCTSREYVYC